MAHPSPEGNSSLPQLHLDSVWQASPFPVSLVPTRNRLDSMEPSSPETRIAVLGLLVFLIVGGLVLFHTFSQSSEFPDSVVYEGQHYGRAAYPETNNTSIDLQKVIFSDKGKRIGHLDGQTVVAESSDENTPESKPGVYELDGTNLILIGDESKNAAYVNLSNASE